ncbi:MAG: hypothetical protein KGL91_06765 [Xanthomonadaceae bacterium]|nr:hypothetical protein [Xanthomonadaceae bacterium]
MMRILAAAVALTGLLSVPGVHAQARKPAAPVAPAATASTQDPAAEAFRQWDRNGDGQLSLVEFRAGWQQAQAAAQVQMQLRRQFSSLDANHDGAIDASEYGNLVLIRNAGKHAPPLARFDANADGKLQFGEYVKLVETLAPQQASNGPGK